MILPRAPVPVRKVEVILCNPFHVEWIVFEFLKDVQAWEDDADNEVMI